MGTALHAAVIRALEPSQKGRRRPGGASIEQLQALIEAGADPSLARRDGLTPLGCAIKYRRKTAEEFLRSIGAPEKSQVDRTLRSKARVLDLSKDFETVYNYLARQVSAFDSKSHLGLGGPGKVKLILIGFEYAQAGWVVTVFDTRSDATPDGEWTSDIDGNALKMLHWRDIAENLIDNPLKMLGLDGTRSNLPAGSEPATLLGNMLKAVLVKARDKKLFSALPKSLSCRLAVEDFDGNYSWPLEDESESDSTACSDAEE